MDQPRPLAPGTRWLQGAATVAVAAALAIVLIRVVGCTSDDLCVFAEGSLKTAVFAFVGGPFLVMMVWAVPAWRRRVEAGSWWGPSLMSAGAVALGVGALFLSGGGPASAVVPSLAPGLVVGGLLATGAGGAAPTEERAGEVEKG